MKKIFLVLIVLSLSLSACGKGGANTKLNITMKEFAYDPMDNQVKAGADITLKIKNEGAVIHEYVIMKEGLSAGNEFGPEDEENIYWEVEVEPGESKTVTFTAPSNPGYYEIVCGTEGHLAAGMRGILTVVE